jgi:pilus assembly protein Flp/PilA
MFFNLLVRLQTLTKREDGQDLVEYALLAALIALAAFASIGSIGTAISTQFSNIAASV